MSKNHYFEITAISFSLVVHAAIAIPYLSGTFTTSSERQTTTPLKLAMFKTPAEPVQAIAPPPPAKPVTPPPKPLKPIVKKKPKPIVKAKPKPVIKPIEKEKPEPPEQDPEPKQEIVQAAPPPQPVALKQAAPEPLMHDLGVISRLEDEYKLTLSKLIDASKRYPRRAQRRNIEGKATVSFVIMRDGSVREIRLIDSTGHQLLDKAVIQAIQAVSGKLPLPEQLNRQQWQFKIPLSFTLS